MKRIIYAAFIMLSLPIFTSCGRIFDGLVDLFIEDKETREIVKESASVAKEIGKETVSIIKEIHEESVSNNLKHEKPDPLDGYKVLTIRKDNIKGKQYLFPYVQYKDKRVEHKINVMLQLCTFGTLIKDLEGNGYDGVNQIVRCAMNDLLPPTYFVDATFSRNICLKIKLSTHTGVKTGSVFNFNPQTGDLYDFREFFDDKDYFKFQSDLMGYEIREEQDLYDLIDFEFSQNTVKFIIANNSRFVPFEYAKLKISDLEPYLNDYGRAALITGEGLENYHSNSYPKLYEGVIGGDSVYYYRPRPFCGLKDALFYLNSGKIATTDDSSLDLLDGPYQKSALVQSDERADVRICDKYWYDCQMFVSHIDSAHSTDTDILSESNSPDYKYKDLGRDLFCYHVVPDGLEGIYQIPLPIDHSDETTLYVDYDETSFNERLNKYGVKPQKYQVKLKKM